MKRIMIGFAAVGLCSAVFADVSSANVVGYQNSATAGDGEYVGVTSTFLPISGNTTLADIKLRMADGDSELMPPGFQLAFLNKDCGTEVVTSETFAQFPELVATYAGRDLAFKFDTDSGNWFLAQAFDDNDFDTPVDEFIIPSGTGIIMNNISDNEAGVQISFAGEVSRASLYATCYDGCYLMTGNVAPAKMTLKDFAVSCADPDGDFMPPGFQLAFLAKNCGTEVVTAENMAKFPALIGTYLGRDLAFKFDTDSGNWFLAQAFDDNDFDTPVDEFEIPAGMAIIMNNISDNESGVKLELPAALPPLE